MDFISQAAFGMDTQSQLDPNDPFAEHARQVLNCMTLGSPFIITASKQNSLKKHLYFMCKS